MKLKGVLRNLAVKKIYNFHSLDITGICTNSRFANPGELFVAIKGSQVDGHEFINDALSKGIRCLVVDYRKAKRLHTQLKKVVIIAVADTRQALISLAANFYRDKIRGLKLIGVTGTNGKTTITYLLESILNAAGFKTGLIGTIDYRLPGRKEKSVNTTPGLTDLYRYFLEMKKANVGYCIMEVSSHALEQERVGGLNFSGAIFTNLTRDHLDYHKNFNNYFAAKRKLFTMLDKKKGCAVINIDDTYGRRLLKLRVPHRITYGINNEARVRANLIHSDTNQTRCQVSYKKMLLTIQSKLIGSYNVYNILAATALCFGLKIKPKHILKGISRLKEVPGRLQLVARKQKVRIFIDYAHTPGALSVVLGFLKEVQEKNKAKIVLVFGCGGQRDKIKRPQMGNIAVSLADTVILTTDNPRSENPADIIDDIKKGIKANAVLVILDRFEAIKKAIQLAKNKDIVLIAGKGHEQVQIFKNKIEHFDDCLAVKRVLRQIKTAYV
jgi:UDP-N-acetylmuramoyl-L-alanyl-D-glutamate--2,6-diaminopimelate ligase